MSRIMQAWDDVLRAAISNDYDEQQNAIFQIGLVLQRHNPHITPESDMYEEALSRDLLRLTLNEQRQTDTVNYLLELAKRHPQQTDSFLYAVGNAQPKTLIEPLLIFLQEKGGKLKPDAAYHALIALEGVLRHPDDLIKDILKQIDINDILDDWSESDDDLLADKALRVAEKIEAIFREV